MNVEEYERLFRNEDRYWWFVARRELAIEWVRRRVPQGGRILDAGSGAGATARDLRALGEVTCCDLSEAALELTRRRGLSRLVRADLQALPFSSGFDCVVALDVIEHVRDDTRALREIARVLRPGGTLVLTAPAFRVLWSGHDVALHHVRRYTLGRLTALVAEAGLRPAKASYAVFFLFPLVAAARIVGRFLSRRQRAGLWWFGAPGNRLLLALMRRENRLLRRLRFPWGVSVLVVAEK